MRQKQEATIGFYAREAVKMKRYLNEIANEYRHLLLVAKPELTPVTPPEIDCKLITEAFGT